MAHFSRDPRFVAILHSGGDVFRHVAAGWLQKPEGSVTAEERSGAKRICYGLIYGIGVGKLATELGISRAQAQEFQVSFMREYSGIATWIQAVRDQARRLGYVETLRGRRRFLPGLLSPGQADRAHAERQAVNTTCQASAADLVKQAMLRVHGRLRDLRLHDPVPQRSPSSGAPSPTGPPVQASSTCLDCRLAARMVLQIHDELLLEVHETWLERVRDFVVAEMIGAGKQLCVPLQVTWKQGRTWGSLES